jgi:hypothetical protein
MVSTAADGPIPDERLMNSWYCIRTNRYKASWVAHQLTESGALGNSYGSAMASEVPEMPWPCQLRKNRLFSMLRTPREMPGTARLPCGGKEITMDFCKSTVQLLPVVFTLVLLALPLSVDVATGQDKPVGGPSGIVDEDALSMPTHEGPVTAPGETFGIEGGEDIPLPCSICHVLDGTNEPAIAVNPQRPNNIAVASLFELRVSTDNGATFSAPTPAQVPAGYGRAGDPSLAFDSQGRLFWTYLGARNDNRNLEVFISQVDPATGAILDGYPVNVTAAAGFPAREAANNNDKEWLAADRFPESPFTDQLYVVWTRFDEVFGTFVHTTLSTDQGLTWSAARTVSASEEGFVWPSHNAVAPNGDVYVAYHSQPTFRPDPNPTDMDPPNPNGTSGQVFVLRSTDGGVTYPQKTIAYTAGNADITFNVQSDIGRALNGSVSWTQGSAQPWVLPDPINTDNVYVVAADDPTNRDHGAGFDDMDVFIVRSTDQGGNWSDPARVNAGPRGTTQFFPTAGIDDQSQCLAVTWYDTRAGEANAAGNFLLDVFLRSSCDGGRTFDPEVQINDEPFDPDVGAPARWLGPPLTLRIGEYNGVAVLTGLPGFQGTLAHAVWTGNTFADSDPTGQQILFDSVVIEREIGAPLAAPDILREPSEAASGD